MCLLHDNLLNDQIISYKDLSRRQVRSLIFHILYAAESHEYKDSLESIVDNLSRGYSIDIPLDSPAFQTAQSIIVHKDELDKEIMPYLQNWRFERIGCCTRLILRFAMWELVHTDIPPSIIINEAVELAKCFSEKDAYKFINGILDEAIKANENQPKKS